MKNFINGTIDGEDFSDSFSGLRRKLIDSFNKFESELGSEKLKDFQPDLRSKGFGRFISFLPAEFDNFDEDYDNDEFHDSIKEAFFKLYKSLDEELDIVK